MGLERALAWLTALLASAAFALAYVTPETAASPTLVLVALVGVAALPFVAVYGGALLVRG